jgi:hypothetical protein
MTSNREKRRIAREGARALRARPGWDPARHAAEDGLEEARRQVGAERLASAAEQAAACAACVRRRAELGDETALCDEHFAALTG